MTGQKIHEWKGYVWALAGTVAFSSLYVFSKAGLNQVHLAQFGLYYFGIGFLLNLFLITVSGKIKQVFSLPAKIIRLLVILAVIDLASNITFFMAVHAIADPSVTSFLGNLFPVFLATLSIIFLKERFTLLEGWGALLAISGAFVISFSGDPDWRKFFIPGTGLVVMNTLLAAIFSMIVKKNIQKVSPEVFNLNSNGWIFLSFLVYFIWSDKPLAIPQSAFWNILASAFFGAFFALLSFYYSYRFIPASRSSIVQSLKGVFVLIIAFFYFGSLPVPLQMMGGTITVAGVLIMTLSQAGYIRIGKVKD